VSQIGRNGRSEDATGAVRVFGIDTLSAKLTEFTTVVEDVGGYVFEMTALDDDIFWSQVADHPGGSFICAPASCRLGVPTVASGSNLVLRAVMASAFKRGAPLLAIIIGSTTSGFNLWLEIAADGLDDRRAREHSRLYRIAAHVAYAGFDLLHYEIPLDFQYGSNYHRPSCRG